MEDSINPQLPIILRIRYKKFTALFCDATRRRGSGLPRFSPEPVGTGGGSAQPARPSIAARICGIVAA
jgi:hypothetical protein